MGFCKIGLHRNFNFEQLNEPVPVSCSTAPPPTGQQAEGCRRHTCRGWLNIQSIHPASFTSLNTTANYRQLQPEYGGFSSNSDQQRRERWNPAVTTFNMPHNLDEISDRFLWETTTQQRTQASIPLAVAAAQRNYYSDQSNHSKIFQTQK